MRSRHSDWFALGVSCLLSAPVNAAAQTAVRVLDPEGRPIPYALVSVRGGTERLVDSLGTARFPAGLRDSTRLMVRRLGFAPHDGPVARSESGEFVVHLEPVGRELAAVLTVAAGNTPLVRAGFYERMQRVQNGAIVGTFVTPEELERRNPSHLSFALQGIPSVRILRALDGAAWALGRSDCQMEVLVDGVRVNLPNPPAREGRRPGGAGGGLHLDAVVHGREIAGVEVYQSTANAPSELIPLTGNRSCGLVVVWTGGRH